MDSKFIRRTCIHCACSCAQPLSPLAGNLTRSSLKTPDNQLKVVVKGKMTSRFVADDSLSILEMHRVGLAITMSNPVHFSLEHNCTVLGVELETS